MPKKTVSILIILSVIAALLCSCSGGEKSLIIPISSDPLCLDPQIADTAEAKLIDGSCYEGLVRTDEKYGIIPGAAEKIDVSEDGLTYTFTLRKGSKWQLLKAYKDVLDDKDYLKNFRDTVNAYDFRFALRRAVDPVTQADDAEKLFCIKNARAVNEGKMDPGKLGAQVVDDRTLVITLERANEDFLRILTLPICMPCHEDFFKATHAKYGLELKYTFCNGPYYVSNWTEDNSLTLIKNEGYEGEYKAAADTLYFPVNGDETSVIKKLKQTTYDCACLSESAADSLKDDKRTVLLSVPDSVTGMCFNCTEETLANANIRRALAQLTKFDEITVPDTVSGRAGGLVPDCCRFGEKSYRETVGIMKMPTYNEASALGLWKKGLKELNFERAAVTIICTEAYSAQMQSAIQNWQKILGTLIVAKVSVVTEDELKDAVRNDKFQIAVYEMTADSSNVTDFLKKFTTESDYNAANLADSAYDKLVSDIINTASGDKIPALMSQAERRLADNAVFCPLFTDVKYLAVNRNLTEIYTSPALETIYFLNGGRA